MINISLSDALVILTMLGSGACSLGLFAWYIIRMVQKSTDAQIAVNARIVDSLNDFKLDVAKNYASKSNLAESEDRLVAALDRLTKEFSDFRGQLHGALFQRHDGHAQRVRD